MSRVTKRKVEPQEDPVRVLGRGLRAQRGVHLTLRTLREAAGMTQVDVTGAAQMDQADISRLEGRESFDDCQISTLQRYLSAIGGRLELVAAFGDKKIIVTGVHAGPSGLSAAKKPLKRIVGRRRLSTAQRPAIGRTKRNEDTTAHLCRRGPVSSWPRRRGVPFWSSLAAQPAPPGQTASKNHVD